MIYCKYLYSMSNNNKNPINSQDDYQDFLPRIARVHSSVLPSIIKSILAFIAFLGVGYYTLWMSANYVKKESFEKYSQKQDDLLETKFGIIQTKLENILNQQLIATEQFKSFNIILQTQQKSIDIMNERITFLERSVFKSNKNNQDKN
jgi:hypothetical protein